MKPIIYIVLLFLCQTSLFAQLISVQNQTGTSLQFDFNEKKVIFIEIENVVKNHENVSLEIKVPTTFNLLTKPYIQLLEVGKKNSTFFAMKSTTSARAGDYSIEMKLLSNNKVLDISFLDLTVNKNSRIDINPINKPAFFQASDNSTLSYLLINNGNMKEKVTLKSTSGEVLGNENITLDVGEKRTVQTKHIFPRDNPSITTISFVLEAYVEGRVEPFTSAFSSSYLYNSTVSSDKFHRFPINASVSYNFYNANNTDFQSIQYDINGSGFIDRESKRELSFIARGPNRFEVPGFGMTDQYYASYKEKKISLEVGDIPYRISELIEGARYARGINFSFNPYINGFNVFYLKPRFFSDIKSEYGISYERRPHSQLNWKVIFMHKDHLVKGEKKLTDFISLISAISHENLNLETEIGLSRTDGNFSVAFSNNGSWNFSKFRLVSNTIVTSKNYFGYYTNSALYSNALNYQISKKIRITLNNNISQLNPSLDEFYYTTSPFYAIQSANLSYFINNNNRFYLSAIAGKREDRQELKSYDFREKVGRFSYKLDLNSWSLTTDTDYGITENLLIEDRYAMEDKIFRNRLSIQFDNRSKVSIGGFAAYLKTTKYITALKRTEFLFYGLNAGLRFNNAIHLNVNFRNNFTPEELYRQQNYIDAVATFNFKNHQISITGTLGKNPVIKSDKIFLGSIKYIAKLNAPLLKKKNLGNLIGTLKGEKTIGVIFNFNNQKIITDKNGQFKLKDIEAGRYNISIEKTSLGYGNILDKVGPLVFDIKEDSTNHISLNVVKTGKIKGTLNVLSEGANKETLENILIEISNQNFSKLTTTNSYGVFTFSELIPGDYFIKIASKNVLNKYNLVSSKDHVTIEKGIDTTFSFQIKKKKKEIHFQSGTFFLNGK